MTPATAAAAPAAPEAPAVALDAGTLSERATVRAFVDNEIREWMDANPDEAESGVLPDHLAEMLELADADINEKMSRIGVVIRRERQAVDAIKTEIAVLQARAKARENGIDRRKRYIDACLHIAGLTRVVTPLVTVSRQNNSPSVVGELPTETLDALYTSGDPELAALVRYTPGEYALDKRAALALHKAGKPLPAGLAVEQTTSIQIR